MARPISRKPIPPLALSPAVLQEIAPKELVFFSPPKGMNTVSPLSALPREASPFVSNLVLDRGVLRSRYGTETYHNADGAEEIQQTTDLGGTSGASADITLRSTAAQGAAAGWNADGNSASGPVGTDITIAAGSRAFCKLGDPAIDNNVDAFDNLYALMFSVTASGVGMSGIYAAIDSSVTLEYSTDDGGSWTPVGDTYTATAGIGTSQTINYSPTILIAGSPTKLWIRLVYRLRVQGSASGNGSGSVSVAAGGGTRKPVTWATFVSASIAERIPTRWTGAHIQTYDDPTDVAGPWTTVYTFPATQINSDNTLPTFITWKDTVISTDIGDVSQGVGKIGSKGLVSTLLATPHTSVILAHSPRAAHLAILGNRVVASRINEWTVTSDPWVESVTRLSRIRWCVKDNSNDWDGLGSGFEDLVIPGGLADEVMGTYPVSDETGIIVSERSIRRMDVTGFADAPFKFALLSDSIGTLSRYAIRAVPGGVIFISYDDAILFTLSGIKRLGTSVLRDSLRAISNPRLAVGYYDAYNSRFLASWREGANNVLWTYSFLDDGWTRITLPFGVVNIDRAFMTVNGVRRYGIYYTMNTAGGFSCRENPSLVTDVDATGAVVDSGIEIRTGYVLTDSPLRRVELVEAQLLYESTATQQLTFEYSVDGGQSWSTYSTPSISATTKPTVLSVRKTLETSGLQVRVKSNTLGSLKLISLHLFVSRGALIRA